MDEDETKSQSLNEYSHVSPNFFVRLAEDVEGFREIIEDILEEIEQDGNFFEMTAELYDQKKSYLSQHLAELSLMHRVLSDQIRTNKLLLSSVDDVAFKDKYSKATEVLVTKNFKLSEEQVESEKANIIELQKEVAELRLASSESSLKMKTMGEELETSKKKMTVSDNVIRELRNQRLQDVRTDEFLLDFKTKQIDSQKEKIRGLQEKLSYIAAEISERDNQITELNKKNKQYMSEIAQLKSTHKAKENSWRASTGKLRKEVEEKGVSIDDLSRKSEVLMLEKDEKDEVNAQFEILRAEKYSLDNLYEEMQTRSHSLKYDHVGAVSSFDNAQKLTTELTQRVLELEREVDMQREVISVRGEEKREAIRQLSSSLEHYKSRYEELHKSFIGINTTSCFDFLH